MIISDITESAYLAWLASAKMPAGSLQELLRQYGTGESVYRTVCCRDDAVREMIPESVGVKLIQTAGEDRLQWYKDRIQQDGIRTITFFDAGFPAVLREIEDPVAILFYQGNLSCLSEKLIGMVGSRQASYSGLKAAHKIARDLSREGVSVVSGFAYGIDAPSHRGCIEGGSPTIAVMGCGLDQNYPADHAGLRKQVLDTGGILLSEYAPGEKPMAGNFPYRNRIISALGEALILVEAKIRSGSLRTVDHALSQGKEVFVYPGDPSSPHYEGNHQLLREGGHYFTSARDIMEDMDWLDKKPRVVQNSGCNDSAPVSSAENSIRKLLLPGALSFDQLAEKSGLLPADLLSLLTILQIRGVVEPLPGKKYQLKQ